MRVPLRRVFLAALAAATSAAASPPEAAAADGPPAEGEHVPSYAPPPPSYAPRPPSYAPPGYAPPGYAPPGYAPPGYAPPPIDAPPPRGAPDRSSSRGDETGPSEAGPRKGGTVDPLVPAGLSAIVPGGMLLLVGLAQEGASGQSGEHQVCGLSGCAEVELSGDVSSSSAFYLGGGGVMAGGGAVMLLAAAASPPRHASPGRARAAGGGLGLSLGAGTVVMGAVGMATDPRSNVGKGLIGFGAAASAVSLPVLVWGASTLDEGEAGDTYASSGRIVGGTVLTSVGLALGVAGTTLVASSSDCGGGYCDLGYVVASFPLAASATCLGIGIPLMIGGAKIADDEVVPDVTVGAGDVRLGWRFQ